MPTVDLFRKSLAFYRTKSADKPKPPQIAGKESYFSECERDEGGQCIPSGQTSGKKPEEQPKQEQQSVESAEQGERAPKEEWQERQRKRSEAVEALNARYNEGVSDEQRTQMVEASAALLSLFPDDGPEAIGGKAADLLETIDAYFNTELETLKQAGATDKELSPLLRSLERGRAKFAKAVEKAKDASAKYAQVKNALEQLEQQEPQEPELPDEPELNNPDEPIPPDELGDEPKEPQRNEMISGETGPDGNYVEYPSPQLAYRSDEDFANAYTEWSREHTEWEQQQEAYNQELTAHEEALKQWEADSARANEEYEQVHSAWEKEVAKAEAAYEKAVAKWEALKDKAETQVSSLEEKTNELMGEIDNVADEVFDEELGGLLNDTIDTVRERIEFESQNDPEPEEEEEVDPTPPSMPDWRKSLPVYDSKDLGPHDYGCLMACFPDDFRKQITDWTLENIPDFHLGPGDRENQPHVTILYGFTGTSKEVLGPLKELLANCKPFPIFLKSLSLFRGNEDGDVLIVEVEGRELRDLNYNISETFPNENNYPEYKPHLTLAYLDPNYSASYTALKPPFLNKTCIIDKVEWSGSDGKREFIKLGILPQNKALSANSELSGGALVPPPKQKDRIPGGLASGKPDSDFDPQQLAAGIKVELEHTNDATVAKEIAKDHLTEDPNYYRKLRRMEGKGWVTMGGHPCTDGPGKHCGGTRIFISKRTGKIRKGPRSMIGKRPNELTKPKPPRIRTNLEPTEKKPAPAEKLRSDRIGEMLRGMGRGGGEGGGGWKPPPGFAEDLARIAGGAKPPGAGEEKPSEKPMGEMTEPPAEDIHEAATDMGKPVMPIIEPSVEVEGGKPSGGASSDPKERESARSSLEGGKVKSADTLGDGGNANETILLEMEDGTKGVFKPFSGETEDLRTGVDAGTYWTREIAASRIAEILGFSDLVPVTTARKEGDKEGSIQQFVEGAKVAAKAGGRKFDGKEDSTRAAVFDYIMGHSDRHQGNWLVTDGGKLVLIDNGLSLPHTYDGNDYFNYEFWFQAARFDAKVPDLSDVADKWGDIENVLRELDLEKEAIKLTKERFDAVVAHSGEKIRDLPAPWAYGSDKTLGGLLGFEREDEPEDSYDPGAEGESEGGLSSGFGRLPSRMKG